ncbi:MAG TPA: hypothetical protein VNZ58_11065 [Thermomicrobiales bacterium]|nr:hypothetical protein [Thermomicrobiales bacterium]
MADENMTRPDVMDTLSETQLSELENQFDENDRNEFNVVADSFGWDEETCNRVWDWLAQGKRNEGFEGAER